MKIQVSNTNAPCWRDITVKSQVPSELNNLVTMSKNLWWVWNSEAIDLFRNIDPDLWRSTNNNPVLMLQRIGYERMEEIVKDKAMMRRIEDVYDDFQKYMNVEKRTDVPSISYFSMEYGLCNILKIYSGGFRCSCRRLSERSQRQQHKHDRRRFLVPVRLFYPNSFY